MSAQSSTPTAPTAAGAPKRDSVLEVMAASMVGTAIEFYDNYCYSIAAASYFGMVFFTDVAKQNPFLATLFSFVTFAVSFLARPLGSLLFGHFGDKLGRKKTLVAALLMMGISTFVVGVLPGYDVLGPLSVVLLCACRAFQGLGLAGEWSGAALVATENAPANKRALWGSFPNLGAPLGFFFAYGVNLVLESSLSQDAMVAWGWRIPFLLSAVCCWGRAVASHVTWDARRLAALASKSFCGWGPCSLTARESRKRGCRLFKRCVALIWSVPASMVTAAAEKRRHPLGNGCYSGRLEAVRTFRGC